MHDSLRFIYLPGGGGGGERDLEAFAKRLGRRVEFDAICYPGWRRYVQPDFSSATFLAELTNEIIRRVPSGPIRLMGLSIGGHFGYAAALRLRELGREVELFCAIDSFIIETSAPSAGWQLRALSDALDLIKQGRGRDFIRMLRSKAWRAVLRLAGRRLLGMARASSGGGPLSSIVSGNAVAEQELSMRLLLRETAPWIASLDKDPAPLPVPGILLRTEASALHDAAWIRRCPNIAIHKVPGRHLTLFEAENIDGLCKTFMTALAPLAVEK